MLTDAAIANSAAVSALVRHVYCEIESLRFLLRYMVGATTFIPVPFVQQRNHLHQPTSHGLEAPLSVAGNGVAALKCDHIAIPVGAFPAGRRFCWLDRYKFVMLFHCFVLEGKLTGIHARSRRNVYGPASVILTANASQLAPCNTAFAEEPVMSSRPCLPCVPTTTRSTPRSSARR